MTPKQELQPKKLYHVPVLQVFGNIREITQNVTTNGKNDPGNGQLKTG